MQKLVHGLVLQIISSDREVFNVYYRSLVPIIIAILLIGYGLLLDVSSEVTTIITIALVVVAILFIALIIYNFCRDATIGNKVGGSVILIISAIICMIETKTFFLGLAESANTSSGWGPIEFGFVLIFGGVVWLGCVVLCAYSILSWMDESYGLSVVCVIGNFVLGGIFGLLPF